MIKTLYQLKDETGQFFSSKGGAKDGA